jgi:hypothetical protein
MGLADVAELLTVSKQHVSQPTARDDSPEPRQRLAAGPVSNRADVERWAPATGRLG